MTLGPGLVLTMKFLVALVCFLPLLSVRASISHRSRPRNIFGQRARNYSFLEAEYKEILKAQNSKSGVKFLVAISDAYPYDQELRQLCSFAKPGVRDIACIDYSKLMRKFNESCTIMLPSVIKLIENAVKTLEVSQVDLSGKLKEARDTNTDSGLFIENMQSFPNAFDPSIWIQAGLYTIQGLDDFVLSKRETMAQVDELMEFIELYKTFMDLAIIQLVEFSNWDKRIWEAKEKNALLIHHLLIEKDQQNSYLLDLYGIRDTKARYC